MIIRFIFQIVKNQYGYKKTPHIINYKFRFIIRGVKLFYMILFYFDVRITDWISPFQSTPTPKQSETNLTGTRVLPFMILAGTSRETCTPLTIAVVLSMVNLIIVPFSVLFAITVCVSPSHSTVAPIFSNIALSGSYVLPFSITGSWSNAILLPS